MASNERAEVSEADSMLNGKANIASAAQRHESGLRQLFSHETIQVMSIDGSTSLAWPSDCVNYTENNPTVSFSCNPLYLNWPAYACKSSSGPPVTKSDLFIINDILEDILGTIEQLGNFREHANVLMQSKPLSDASNLNGHVVDIKNVMKRRKKLKKSIKRFKEQNSTNAKVHKEVEPLLEPTTSAIQKEVETEISEDQQDQKNERIKINFRKNVSHGSMHHAFDSKMVANSRWDTSSDEDGALRRGAISYKFSEDSDNCPSPCPKVKLSDTKPIDTAVGQASHTGQPDIGNNSDKPVAEDSVKIKNSCENISSDHSDEDHHRRSRTLSRSRSRSYSSYSDSYSSSYTRSYSRSSSSSVSRSRSAGGYRRSYSHSQSFSSYSSDSYSSRSRSRSRSARGFRSSIPSYKYGSRRKQITKSSTRSEGHQQSAQNIQLQQETGLTKAQDMIRRLKAQKKAEQEAAAAAKAALVAAASSAGIIIPCASTSGSGKSVGAGLLSSFSSVSNHLIGSNSPCSVQANQQQFIGPVRPANTQEKESILQFDVQKGSAGDDIASNIEISKSQLSQNSMYLYRGLQEKAAIHAIGNSISPSSVGTPFSGVPVDANIDSAQGRQTASTPGQSIDPTDDEDGQAPPHEAVVQSYANQILMSQHKAVIAQSQPVFTNATGGQQVSLPQAGVPLQAGTPMMVATGGTTQFQLAQAHALAQAQQAAQLSQALQLQQLQQLVNLGMVQPGLHLAPGNMAASALTSHPWVQTPTAYSPFVQVQPAQGLSNQPLILNGQPHLVIQRYQRPM